MSSNSHLAFGLSATTPQYEYQSRSHYVSVLDHEFGLFAVDPSRSQYILFTGVTDEVFRRDLKNESTEIETYSFAHELVIVKMGSHTHAYAHSLFNRELLDKLKSMQIPEENLRFFASAHVQGDDRIKRADQIYQPRRLPPNRSRHWPSLVLEAGYTEGQRKLESDINWWITQSNGDVKCGVTIAVNPRVTQIVICQWYSDNPEQRVYYNEISQKDQEAIKTSNPDPLVIQFDHIFLREPDGRETDVTLSIDDLKDLANLVWEVQFE